MSLDVYLHEARSVLCAHCKLETPAPGDRIFNSNITHNLAPMAKEAGIYQHLWRPEELGITRAHQLIDALRAGVELMDLDPQRFRQFESPNGWGRYEDFVPWVKSYLDACRQNPDAFVSVWR